MTSGGNQGGAAILDDGSTPVVVKAGETYGPESVIAAHLINSVGRKRGMSGDSAKQISAPKARLAAIGEPERIAEKMGEQAVRPADLDEVEFAKERYDSFIVRLSQPGFTIIFGYAGGKDVSEITRSQPEDTADNGPLRAFGSPDFLRSLGQSSAVDIYTGNRDRLFSVNLGNLRMEADSMSAYFIDNIHERGFSQMHSSTTLALSAFKNWARSTMVKSAAAKKYEDLAEQAITGLSEQLKSKLPADGVRSFAQGLQEGIDELLQMLKPEDVFKMVSPFGDQANVTFVSMCARAMVLGGRDADEAWKAASALGK